MTNILPALFNREKITKEILLLKKDIGSGIIRLGQLLMESKENLPKGEWMEWLRRDVSIPYVSAYRYMKIATELDAKTIERVGLSKIYEVLELPPSTFRDELLNLAPALKREDIREIVSEHKYPQADKEKEEKAPDAVDGQIIEEAVSPTAHADTAMEINATLLDALLQVKFEGLPPYYYDLLASQLKKTLKQVVAFLEKLEYARPKE